MEKKPKKLNLGDVETGLPIFDDLCKNAIEISNDLGMSSERWSDPGGSEPNGAGSARPSYDYWETGGEAIIETHITLQAIKSAAIIDGWDDDDILLLTKSTPPILKKEWQDILDEYDFLFPETFGEKYNNYISLDKYEDGDCTSPMDEDFQMKLEIQKADFDGKKINLKCCLYWEKK